MASTRRRGSASRRGPDLGGTLGSLVRSTIEGAGAVRNVLERGAREGRAKLDEVRRTRKLSDAYAALGELVYQKARDGRGLDFEDDRDVLDALATIEDVEAQTESSESGDSEFDRVLGTVGRGVDSALGAITNRVAPRSRFDNDRHDEDAPPERAEAVSSASCKPPAASAARVWRPPTSGTPSSPAGRSDTDRTAAPVAAPRRGGIQFDRDADDDSDLAQYMHPDDVPPAKK